MTLQKNNIKIYDFPQKSPEWIAIRKGKMTASRASAIGNCGKGLETYITEIMAEKYSSAEPDGYVSRDMQKGIDNEPIAAFKYECERDCTIANIGFIEYSQYVGGSPDGLIGDDGGIEIKCPSDKVFFTYCLTMKIDPTYMWQIQCYLLISGRKWWDYVVYNENFKDSLIVQRVLPDPEKYEKLLAGFVMGEKLIKEIETKWGKT